MSEARRDRRSLLRLGVLGASGLALPELLRHEARAVEAGRSPDRERSVIILWMRGGPSQHDMWDPKPEAPAEIRGEFAPIATSVPGVQLTELLPLTAARMHKWALVRSLHHRPEDGNVGHSDGDQVCFTGYPARPGDADTNVMPSVGAYVARYQQALRPELPAWVMIPRMVPGTGPAWLGSAFGPFETQADPANHDIPFRAPNFTPPPGVDVARVEQRAKLLGAIDRLERSRAMHAVDAFQGQALDILTGGAAQRAFDLESEPRGLRERYGFQEAFDPRDPTRCGAPNWAQRMLLARRLVEAGVRLVTVDLRWWDFHVQGFDSQRRGFLPRWDQAYSALIDDLESRGMLDKTLVVAWGEIGRTPRVNAQAGRDHWPGLFSAAFVGGGVRGGTIVGASDRTGSEPLRDAKIPHDVLATIYRHLGIDVTQTNIDPNGRPHPVLPHGRVIEELFA
jgi:hypothetical protein